MGCKELIDSLRRAADEKLLEIRQQAKDEAEALKKQYSLKAEESRQEEEARLDVMIKESTADILSDAKSKALLIKLSSEKEIADRLYRLAIESLDTLRDNGYGGVFSTLTEELPPLTWKTVHVNPADVDLAGRHFPSAAIVTDADISGGMDAMTEDGKIRAVNTFEKRLERSWERMVPLLMKELHGRTDKHGAS